MEFTLLWAALLGFALLSITVRLEQRAGLVDPEWHFNDTLIGAAAIGLFAGRFAAMVVQGTNPLRRLTDIVIVRGGVDTVAASVTAIAALSWAIRKDLWRRLDLAGPPALAGLAGWHAGCLFRGACLGEATDLPWAFSLPGSPLSRHPTELYAAALFAAAAILAFRLLSKNMSSGVLGAISLTAAAGVRLFTQPIRPSLDNRLAVWYAGGVVVGLTVAVWRWRVTRVNPRTSES